MPLGIGINFGEAYVGKVGTGDVNDFTVLGDTVSTAARLQAHAKAGEVVVSEVSTPISTFSIRVCSSKCAEEKRRSECTSSGRSVRSEAGLLLSSAGAGARLGAGVLSAQG